MRACLFEKSAVEMGQQAGAHQRGFAAARGADHRQQAAAAERAQDVLALPLAPEKQVRVVGFERAQPRERILPLRGAIGLGWIGRHCAGLRNFTRKGSSVCGSKVSPPRTTRASLVATSSFSGRSGPPM